jgi:membrane-associated protease RseP (regulator of RpoE activity)
VVQISTRPDVSFADVARVVDLVKSEPGIAFLLRQPESVLPQTPMEELRVLALKHVRATDAVRIVEQMNNKALSVAVAERTNSLIVRGTRPVLEEVAALLQRLDTQEPVTEPASAASATGGDGTGLRVNVPALGPEPLALDFSVPVSSAQGQTFSFSIGLNGQSADNLQRQYEALEQRTRNLSDELRKPLPDPATGETLKSQLRDTVRQAFETRQNLQRAELAEFAQRLKEIHESIELRDKVSQQIIDRRVDELLDPNLKWDEPGTNSGRAPALRTDSLSSRSEKSTPDGSRRAATTSEQELEGPRDDVGEAPRTRPSPDALDPDGSRRAATTFTWNLMGVVFRTHVVDRDLGASIPNPEHRAHEGRCLEAVYVQEGGPAARAGLAVGDLLISIDRLPIHSVVDISRAWQDTEPATPRTVHLMRNGKPLTIQLRWSSRMRKPLNVEGKVLTRAGDQLEVLLGADDGLQVGNRLVIRSAKAEPVFHSAEIVTLQADTSVARIVVEEKRFPIEAGDIALFSTGVAFEPRPTVSVDAAPMNSPDTAAQPLKAADKLESKPPEKPVDDEEMRRPKSEPLDTPSVQEALNPQSSRTPIQDEKAISKLVLTFFQDSSRRAVPCVVVKINEEYFAVTTSPATVVPDGTPHAIDRSVVEWSDGSQAIVTYDERSTKELQLYRFADDAVIPEPQRSAAEIVIDAIPTVGLDKSLEVGVPLSALTAVRAGSLSETRVRVSAVNVSQKLTLPSHKVEHQYDGLFSVDAALPEGTPVFLDGKLVGLTILGSRFVGEEARQSYVFPANRLWEFCNKVP